MRINNSKIFCFEDLWVDRNISLADFKKAYWNLEKKYHPDLNLNNEKGRESLLKKLFNISFYMILRKFMFINKKILIILKP